MANLSQNRALKGSTVQMDEANEKTAGVENSRGSVDELANDAEVLQAITNLYHDVSMKKRLVAIAALILHSKPQLKRQYQPEDLFQEAIERILIGNRKWPKNRVDFPGLVKGVMKSWASSLEKTKSKEDNMVVMEYEFAPRNESNDALNLEEIAIDSNTPLEQLEAQESDALEQCLLTILKVQYGQQTLEAKILDALGKKPFETHEEIRLALGVKAVDYRNAWKVLMRAAIKLEPKE
jgi:hypothetical protein